MVLKIPFSTVKDFQDEKIFTLILNGNYALASEFIQKMKQRKVFLANVLQKDSMSDAELIPLLTKFFLKFYLLHEFTMKEFKDTKCFSVSKYPIKIQILLKEEEWRTLEKSFDELKLIFSKKFNRNGNIEIDNFFIVMQALYYADENEENFNDFAIKNFNPKTFKENDTGPKDMKPKHCFVCGGEIMPGIFSYFATEKIKNSVCQKCIRFSEMSANSDTSKWNCQEQNGYCALLTSFQYIQSVLYYSSGGGQLRQYVSNCNVLCKKCRYKRCLMIGLGSQDENSECVTCIICDSNKNVNHLKICGSCQEFLTDSVAEASHTSMTCLQSGTCQINMTKTESFSACPGCWITKLRTSGVLDQYLATQIDMKQEVEVKVEIKEEIITGDQCIICDKMTENQYRDKTVCVVCKKFVMKCVKSRCYKDFCCAQNSSCDMSVKTPCSFCWWSRCVMAGLVNTSSGSKNNT